MTDNKERLTLRYFGGTADTGEMNYYEAAGSIIAFGDLMGLVAEHSYGGEAVLKTNVVGLKDNCFAIEFLLGFFAPVAAALPLVANLSPREIWETLKGLLGLYRFLEGQPPKSVVNEDADVVVENNNGKIIHVTKNVYNTIIAPGVGDAVAGFIGTPLAGGHSRAEIENQSTHEKLEFDESEADYFKSVLDPNVISEQTVEVALMIAALSFKKGNKWRFDDGQSTFSAAMEDKEFLKRVDGGERFAKGDVLRSKVTYRQVLRNGKLGMEHIVQKVLSHEVPSQQPPLMGAHDEGET